MEGIKSQLPISQGDKSLLIRWARWPSLGPICAVSWHGDVSVAWQARGGPGGAALAGGAVNAGPAPALLPRPGAAGLPGTSRLKVRKGDSRCHHRSSQQTVSEGMSYQRNRPRCLQGLGRRHKSLINMFLSNLILHTWICYTSCIYTCVCIYVCIRVCEQFTSKKNRK